MTDKEPQIKEVRIKFDTKEQRAIEFLMKQYATIKNIQGLIRMLIDEKYHLSIGDELRYGGKNKREMTKEEKKNKINEIRNMTNEELRQYCIDVGYFADGFIPYDSKGNSNYNAIKDSGKSSSLRGYYFEYHYIKPFSGGELYFNNDQFVMTVDELINDLIKKKLV